MTAALLYVRVSSKEQEKEGWSLDAQEKLGIEYAHRHNLKIVKTWKVQESAWSNKKERVAFNQMIDYAKKHDEVKHIIFDITDRMTRNDFDKMKIIDLIKDFDKTIHFSRSNKIINKNSGSEDIFILDIEVAVAKKMSNDISRKSQMGMLEKAEQGFYPSTAPFGYRNNKLTRLIELDPNDAPFVKNAFEQMATGNYSIAMLADWLFEHGFKSRGGRKIYKSALDKVLKNPIYYGVFRWKGKLYEGNHEKIITKQLFDEVQAVFERKTKPYKTRKGFAFANLLNCGECGCKVLGEEKKKRYVYYHCSFSKGRHNGIGYIPENRLAEMFEPCVLGVTLPDDKVEWFKENFQQRHKNTAETAQKRLLRLQSDYERANTRLSKLYDLKLDGGIPEEIFASKEKEYQTELMSFKSQLNTVTKVNPNFYEDGCKILELSNSLHRLYLKANHQEKSHLLKLIASNYRLNDVNISPTYRKPLSFIAEGLLRSQWLPREDSRRNWANPSKCKEIRILVKMCRRRGRCTAISLYDPLPPLPQAPRPVYKNIVAMAVRVNEYLVQNPQRTQTAAGNHFGVTRARVSQLMTIIEKLPDSFISIMKTTEDQSLLKRFSGKTLLRIAKLKTLEQYKALETVQIFPAKETKSSTN